MNQSRRRNFRDVERVSPENAPEIPKAAYEGIEACRESGDCNMYEFTRVMRWCFEHEYHSAVVWMDENPSKYGTGVFSCAWRVVSETGAEVVDYGEKEMYAGLPEELLASMNTELNEERQHTSQVVGKRFEPVN